MELSTQIRGILRRIIPLRLRPFHRGGHLPLRETTTRTAPATIPRVVPIAGWPRPNPIPNPVATPAVIHPAAWILGARHSANVDDRTVFGIRVSRGELRHHPHPQRGSRQRTEGSRKLRKDRIEVSASLTLTTVSCAQTGNETGSASLIAGWERHSVARQRSRSANVKITFPAGIVTYCTPFT